MPEVEFFTKRELQSVHYTPMRVSLEMYEPVDKEEGEIRARINTERACVRFDFL